MRIDDFRVLIVPGLHDSGDGHWQTSWQRLFPHFERVVQDDWDKPDLHTWSERVGQVLRRSDRPVLVAAHSFGCLATIHRASVEAGSIAGVLLVAPADPARFGIVPQMRRRELSCPSIVVGSLNDPWMEARRAADWAEEWKSEFIYAGALGHINADSQLGDWEFGLSLLSSLAAGCAPAAT